MNTNTASTEGCWLFAGYINNQGYGRIGLHSAHRVVYENVVGPIPEGLVLDHLCRVRHCINPVHLEPVTNEENIRRGLVGEINRSRILAVRFCKRGHELSGDNLRLRRPRPHSGVSRVCRRCCAIRSMELRRRR